MAVVNAINEEDTLFCCCTYCRVYCL